MALIGFTVFKEKILDGSKAQTIRKSRKVPIRVGEPLYLYWHLRRPDCEKLGVAKCSEVFIRRWSEMKNDLELAKRDGFDSLYEFRSWFARYNPHDETKFMIVRWMDFIAAKPQKTTQSPNDMRKTPAQLNQKDERRWCEECGGEMETSQFKDGTDYECLLCGHHEFKKKHGGGKRAE